MNYKAIPRPKNYRQAYKNYRYWQSMFNSHTFVPVSWSKQKRIRKNLDRAIESLKRFL